MSTEPTTKSPGRPLEPRRRGDFGARLTALRRERELTQAALAARAGLQATTISMLELGHRKPSWATLQALASGLAISAGELLDD